MKKDDYGYSASVGLFRVTDGRQRKDSTGDFYFLVEKLQNPGKDARVWSRVTLVTPLSKEQAEFCQALQGISYRVMEWALEHFRRGSSIQEVKDEFNNLAAKIGRL